MKINEKKCKKKSFNLFRASLRRKYVDEQDNVRKDVILAEVSFQLISQGSLEQENNVKQGSTHFVSIVIGGRQLS